MRAVERRIAPPPIHRNGSRIRPLRDPAAAEPNDLRDAVYEALSSLSATERSEVRKTLLAELDSAGLRVTQCLFMLGVSARTPDELTAPEIAALIRYVRLTEPKVMMAVAEPLREILTLSGSEEGASARAA